MKIINAYPPNIKELAKHFPITPRTVFTYGDILYNPGGGEINKALMAHEETHARQQEQMGIEEWWGKYIADPKFRLSQELEAYANQVREARKQHYNFRKLQLLINQTARDLSSGLYGNIIDHKEALEQINKLSQ